MTVPVLWSSLWAMVSDLQPLPALFLVFSPGDLSLIDFNGCSPSSNYWTRIQHEACTVSRAAASCEIQSLGGLIHSIPLALTCTPTTWLLMTRFDREPNPTSHRGMHPNYWITTPLQPLKKKKALMHRVEYLNEIQQHQHMKNCQLNHDILHQTSGFCNPESHKLAECREAASGKGHECL